jgi:hypothetical protein
VTTLSPPNGILSHSANLVYSTQKEAMLRHHMLVNYIDEGRVYFGTCIAVSGLLALEGHML